jgi:hypothetical protein
MPEYSKQFADFSYQAALASYLEHNKNRRERITQEKTVLAKVTKTKRISYTRIELTSSFVQHGRRTHQLGMDMITGSNFN